MKGLLLRKGFWIFSTDVLIYRIIRIINACILFLK